MHFVSIQVDFKALFPSMNPANCNFRDKTWNHSCSLCCSGKWRFL